MVKDLTRNILDIIYNRGYYSNFVSIQNIIKKTIITSESLPTIFSWKVTRISIFSCQHNIPVSRNKKCYFYHQVVSGVKKMFAKNFPFKRYPFNHILKRILWSVLHKPKLTGAFADYRSTGEWIGRSKKNCDVSTY